MKKIFISQPMKDKTNEFILADADITVFTHGWKDARGCKIEHICAEEYGIKFIVEM